MNSPKPIRERNAIDEISFGVSFKSPISNINFIKEFINIENKWEKLFPEYELIEGIGVAIEAAADKTSFFVRHPGITRYKLSTEALNRKKWVMRIDSSQIVVACSEYSSWKKESEKFLDAIKFLLSKIDNKINKIASIDFRCVDEFTGGESIAEGVLNTDSIYLATHLFDKNNENWHYSQGWNVKAKEIKLNVSHTLRINKIDCKNSDDFQKKISIIHIIKIKDEAQSNILNSESLFDKSHKGSKNEGLIKKVFNESHKQNKILLKNLLKNELLKKISLTE